MGIKKTLFGSISKVLEGRFGISAVSEWEEKTELFMAFLGIWSLPSIVLFFVDEGVSGTEELIFLIFYFVIFSIFLLDYFIRAVLSHVSVKFILTHPIALLSVVFPPIRFLLSFQILGRLFKRGNFRNFAFIAVSFVIMGAFLIYYFEHDAMSGSASQLETRFDAFWWALVTSTTVGFGDVVPVTTEGRIVAIGLMLTGLTLYAMVTARIAQNFLFNDSRRKKLGIPEHISSAEDIYDVERDLAVISDRLDRIEKILSDGAAGENTEDGKTPSEKTAESGEADPGSAG